MIEIKTKEDLLNIIKNQNEKIDLLTSQVEAMAKKEPEEEEPEDKEPEEDKEEEIDELESLLQD